jgi:hypothetical protein
MLGVDALSHTHTYSFTLTRTFTIFLFCTLTEVLTRVGAEATEKVTLAVQKLEAEETLKRNDIILVRFLSSLFVHRFARTLFSCLSQEMMRWYPAAQTVGPKEEIIIRDTASMLELKVRCLCLWLFCHCYRNVTATASVAVAVTVSGCAWVGR